jgi:pSer/pThr/pTyr-binding forkhead associated (FHA) protein
VSAAGDTRRFVLKPDGVNMGRAPDNDVVITQEFPGWDTISHKHAYVYRQAGHWIVQDLGSTNGVWVNGKRTGLNLLQDGWQLRIGGVEFVFHAGAGEGAR